MRTEPIIASRSLRDRVFGSFMREATMALRLLIPLQLISYYSDWVCPTVPSGSTVTLQKESPLQKLRNWMSFDFMIGQIVRKTRLFCEKKKKDRVIKWAYTWVINWIANVENDTKRNWIAFRKREDKRFLHSNIKAYIYRWDSLTKIKYQKNLYKLRIGIDRILDKLCSQN